MNRINEHQKESLSLVQPIQKLNDWKANKIFFSDGEQTSLTCVLELHTGDLAIGDIKGNVKIVKDFRSHIDSTYVDSL